MARVFIASYQRTPFVKFAGVFQNLTAVTLGKIAAESAIKKAKIDPGLIDYVVVGQVLQTLVGQNPARQTSIAAGIPWSTPGTTVNSVCLSGMEAIAHGTRLIESGERHAVLVVGQESMSQAPHAAKLRMGTRYGSLEFLDTVEFDGLTDVFSNSSMGVLTDEENKRLKISRAEQDGWAARSHQLAQKFKEFLAEEIVPVDAGKFGIISEDNGIRPDTTVESLASLRAAFSSAGTITAGNASQITDGAAAVVLLSEDMVKQTQSRALAEIVSHAHVAGPDATLQSQPSNAILAAMAKKGLSVGELQSLEINEAFAAVVAQSVRDLDMSESLVNPHSGAIALGHPIGASGTRIVGHLARSLHQLGPGNLGAAGICGGGGQGSAVILRSV